MDASLHRLVVEVQGTETIGRCSCGAWSREVDRDVVTVTGRSRSVSLRRAHALHARAPPTS